MSYHQPSALSMLYTAVPQTMLLSLSHVALKEKIVQAYASTCMQQYVCVAEHRHRTIILTGTVATDDVINVAYSNIPLHVMCIDATTGSNEDSVDASDNSR